MDLSESERLILSNQYKILEELDSDQAFEYRQHREIVERGYMLSYGEISTHIFDELSMVGCREVLDILDMHHALQQSFHALEDQQGITIRFAGLMEEEGLIKKDFVATNWRRSIVKCWESAQPLIEKYKKEREKDFLDHFKMLYERAKYFDERSKTSG